MSPAQVKLLRECIYAARMRELARDRKDLSRDVIDTELVEVGRVNGIDKRTADSLVALGLLVEDYPAGANEVTHVHVRLPKVHEIPGYYHPYESEGEQ